MNDSVDLARDGVNVPEGNEDMVQMLKDLNAGGVEVRVCGTCQNRCGTLQRAALLRWIAQIDHGRPALSGWLDSEKVLTF